MYKSINDNFVIKTIKNYDSHTKELRQELSRQYAALNERDEVMNAIAYPLSDVKDGCVRQNDHDVLDIYERYCDLEKQRIADIKMLMRDITEEQESMNRVMAAYECLDTFAKEIIRGLYIDNKDKKINVAAESLAAAHGLSKQSIFRLRQKAFNKIIDIYNSDLTQSEIYQIRNQQDSDCIKNKQKYR